MDIYKQNKSVGWNWNGMQQPIYVLIDDVPFKILSRLSFNEDIWKIIIIFIESPDSLNN